GLEGEPQLRLVQLELRVVPGAVTLRDVTLRDRGAQEEASSRDDSHEELQHDEARLGAFHHEWTRAVHRAPDGEARCDERHRRGPALAQAKRRPDHEREDRVLQGIPLESEPEPAGEYDETHGDERPAQG